MFSVHLSTGLKKTGMGRRTASSPKAMPDSGGVLSKQATTFQLHFNATGRIVIVTSYSPI